MRSLLFLLALFAVACGPARRPIVALQCPPPTVVRVPVAAPPVVVPRPTPWITLTPTDSTHWSVALTDPTREVRLQVVRTRPSGRCNSSLSRLSADGHWWCMATASIFPVTYVTLSAARPSAEFTLDWLHGAGQGPIPLPPGRYQLSLDLSADEGRRLSTVRAFFVVSAALPGAEALISRVRTTLESRCTPVPAHVARALARSTDAALTRPLLAIEGDVDDRVMLLGAMAELPEIHGAIVDALDESRSYLESTAVLNYRSLFNESERLAAERVFARDLPRVTEAGASGVYAMHRSQWHARTVSAYAQRITNTRDDVDLGRWLMAMSCLPREIDASSLGELVAALRARAAATRDRATAASLRQRATEMLRRLDEERAELTRQRRIALGWRDPRDREMGTMAGCGFGFARSTRTLPAACPQGPWPDEASLTATRSMRVVESEEALLAAQ